MWNINNVTCLFCDFDANHVGIWSDWLEDGIFYSGKKNAIDRPLLHVFLCVSESVNGQNCYIELEI